MTRKSLIIFTAVIALVAVGVFTVMAQDDDDATPPFGMMWGGHGGMMHGGIGMGWANHDTMMATVAEALGLEPEALVDALHNGQTLTEIAEEQGVELQTVYDAMLTQAEEHMTALVDAGTITQEQADEHLTWMQEHVAEMPMFSGGGFGPHMGHHGMMGRGHRMMWNN